MRQLLLLLSAAFIINKGLMAQTTFPNNGAPNNIHTLYAFTNCTLHVDAEVTIVNATLFVKDGVIVNAGANLVSSKDAITVDLKGKHIYTAALFYTAPGSAVIFLS